MQAFYHPIKTSTSKLTSVCFSAFLHFPTSFKNWPYLSYSHIYCTLLRNPRGTFSIKKRRKAIKMQQLILSRLLSSFEIGARDSQGATQKNYFTQIWLSCNGQRHQCSLMMIINLFSFISLANLEAFSDVIRLAGVQMSQVEKRISKLILLFWPFSIFAKELRRNTKLKATLDLWSVFASICSTSLLNFLVFQIFCLFFGSILDGACT